MNYLIPQPLGEDAYVNDLQVGMYANLPARLGLDASKWNCFGRAYRNYVPKTDTTPAYYLPEYFYNGEYIAGNGTSNRGGLFFEDGFVVSFFGEREKPMERKASGYNCWYCELIFFIDLSILSPYGITDTANQRIDEIVINIFKNYIESSGCGFHVENTERNIDKVLEMYSGFPKIDSLNKNMQPRLCFKFDLELIYNPILRAMPVPRNLNPMETLIVLFIVNSPDRTGITKTIPVGDGQYIYQEYAPSDTLTPLLVGTSSAYLAGKPVTYLTFDNQPDTLAIEQGSYSVLNGVWDRTGQGTPFGFNASDFAAINFIDQV